MIAIVKSFLLTFIKFLGLLGVGITATTLI